MNELLAPEALPCAIFLVTALSIAGCAHTLWLWSRFSLALAIPIDGGKSLGGHRVFGDNKTWRGLVMMPLASSVVFAFAAAIRDAFPTR